MMPSQVPDRVGLFDRFAAAAARTVSRAVFFAACLLLVLVWAPSFWLFGSVDTWQLAINTATTIVTFVLVALLQNSQRRADKAIQHKLNAVAAGIAAVLTEQIGKEDDRKMRLFLIDSRRELLLSVGLENRESS